MRFVGTVVGEKGERTEKGGPEGACVVSDKEISRGYDEEGGG